MYVCTYINVLKSCIHCFHGVATGLIKTQIFLEFRISQPSIFACNKIRATSSSTSSTHVPIPVVVRLRLGSTCTPLQGSLVRIMPRAWMVVSCVGNELVANWEESYRVCVCVCVCFYYVDRKLTRTASHAWKQAAQSSGFLLLFHFRNNYAKAPEW